MTYVVPIDDAAPPPRNDGIPFIEALIQQSPPTGPEVWTTLETRDLDPIDSDPTSPALRDFTTTLATLEIAKFRIVWRDASGAQSPGDIIHPLRPTLDDIGALERARTSVMGSELGTFTADTRPTGDEVENLINQAETEIRPITGFSPPLHLRAAVRALTALRTAMLIEASYFPESSDNAYDHFRELYEDLLGYLTTALEGNEPASNTRLASLRVTTLVAESSPYLELDALLP